MRVVYQTDRGVNYMHILTGKECAGIMAIGEKKDILNGELRLTKVMEGSSGYLRYGEELQIRILTHKDKVDKIDKDKPRHNDDWNTTEICIPFNMIDDVIIGLQKIKNHKQKVIQNGKLL